MCRQARRREPSPSTSAWWRAPSARKLSSCLTARRFLPSADLRWTPGSKAFPSPRRARGRGRRLQHGCVVQRRAHHRIPGFSENHRLRRHGIHLREWRGFGQRRQLWPGRGALELRCLRPHPRRGRRPADRWPESPNIQLSGAEWSRSREPPGNCHAGAQWPRGWRRISVPSAG